MAVQKAKRKFEGVAVDLDFEVAIQGTYLTATAKFDTAPSTSEDFTITLVDPDDEDFNVVLESDDPSSDPAVTDLVFRYRPFPLGSRMKIKAEYPNSDDRTIAVTIWGTDTIMMP